MSRHLGRNHVAPQALGLEHLPCPFCAFATVGVAMGHTYHVTCASCGAEGPVMRRPADAVQAWNDRRKEPAKREPMPRYDPGD